MRVTIVVFLSVVMLAASGAWAETVYKCRNPQGKLIYQETPCKQDVEAVSSWAAAVSPVQQTEEAGTVSGGIYVIRQRDNGHYFLDGTINGKPLTFVVDTGASSVSLPRTVAYLARMSCKEQVQLSTANGTTSGCIAVIANLKFGPFLLKDVPATIVPNLDQPLLGMNVLQQFKIEQDNGEMKISIKK